MPAAAQGVTLFIHFKAENQLQLLIGVLIGAHLEAIYQL